MNLILVKREEICGERVRLEGRRFAHARDMLKIEAGKKVKLGVSGATRFVGQVERVGADFCEVALVAECGTLPRAGIDVLLALPRPKCLKRLLPQIAALGVGRLYITGAEKVEKNYWGSRFLEPEIFQPLLEEGLEQAGDTIAPEVVVARRLKPLLEDVIAAEYAEAVKLLAHPETETTNDNSRTANNTLIAVGPEGGWTEYELGMFGALGFKKVSLGPRILRTDTAVVALVTAAKTFF